MEYVQLQSEDGVVFPISRGALKRSKLLSLIAGDELNCGVIKLQTVTSSALAKVLQYLEAVENIAAHEDEDDFVEWRSCGEPGIDQQFYWYSSKLCAYKTRFLESMSLPIVVEVTKAADFLRIASLLDIGLREIINQIRGLSTEELKRTLRIRGDIPHLEACIDVMGPQYMIWQIKSLRFQ